MTDRAHSVYEVIYAGAPGGLPGSYLQLPDDLTPWTEAFETFFASLGSLGVGYREWLDSVYFGGPLHDRSGASCGYLVGVFCRPGPGDRIPPFYGYWLPTDRLTPQVVDVVDILRQVRPDDQWPPWQGAPKKIVLRTDEPRREPVQRLSEEERRLLETLRPNDRVLVEYLDWGFRLESVLDFLVDREQARFAVWCTAILGSDSRCHLTVGEEKPSRRLEDTGDDAEDDVVCAAESPGDPQRGCPSGETAPQSLQREGKRTALRGRIRSLPWVLRFGVAVIVLWAFVAARSGNVDTDLLKKQLGMAQSATLEEDIDAVRMARGILASTDPQSALGRDLTRLLPPKEAGVHRRVVAALDRRLVSGLAGLDLEGNEALLWLTVLREEVRVSGIAQSRAQEIVGRFQHHFESWVDTALRTEVATADLQRLARWNRPEFSAVIREAKETQAWLDAAHEMSQEPARYGRHHKRVERALSTVATLRVRRAISRYRDRLLRRWHDSSVQAIAELARQFAPPAFSADDVFLERAIAAYGKIPGTVGTDERVENARRLLRLRRDGTVVRVVLESVTRQTKITRKDRPSDWTITLAPPLGALGPAESLSRLTPTDLPFGFRDQLRLQLRHHGRVVDSTTTLFNAEDCLANRHKSMPVVLHSATPEMTVTLVVGISACFVESDFDGKFFVK
jgi:hypothetical protein